MIQESSNYKQKSQKSQNSSMTRSFLNKAFFESDLNGTINESMLRSNILGDLEEEDTLLDSELDNLEISNILGRTLDQSLMIDDNELLEKIKESKNNANIIN